MFLAGNLPYGERKKWLMGDIARGALAGTVFIRIFVGICPAMQKIEYTLCHGSGNRFVLIDAVRHADALAGCDLAAFARDMCRLCGGRDGLLLLVRRDGAVGMRMFNPDGSEAEMCGNGIRCVARLARRYVDAERFSLVSGGRSYEITAEEPLPGGIPVFGVTIPVNRLSGDFLRGGIPAELLGGPLPELDAELRFTYLHPGNPHLVACAEEIDLRRLEQLGQRITERTDIFPHGANLSLFRVEGPQHIRVATFERGAGLTASCGTAMTSCSTAACLLGICRSGETIRVSNRGGEVRCLCLQTGEHPVTRLSGNATFEAKGLLELDAATGGVALCGEPIPCSQEVRAYAAWLESLRAE